MKNGLGLSQAVFVAAKLFTQEFVQLFVPSGLMFGISIVVGLLVVLFFDLKVFPKNGPINFIDLFAIIAWVKTG